MPTRFLSGILVAAAVLLGCEPERHGGPAEPARRALWPQDSRQEAIRAQAAADSGDARYAWQLEPDGEEVVLRYAREELGWAQPQPLVFHIPEGQDWVRQSLVIRCAPGPHTDYPEIDCGLPENRTYAAVNLTVERLVRRDPGGIWIVTEAEPTEFHQPRPAANDQVRMFVVEFLERRVRGSGAESFLSMDARSRFGGSFTLGPLYRSIAGFRYGRYEIVFADGPLWPFGSFEVGVRLLAASGPGVHEETLFVGPGTDSLGERRPLLILGGRRGLTGP